MKMAIKIRTAIFLLLFFLTNFAIFGDVFTFSNKTKDIVLNYNIDFKKNKLLVSIATKKNKHAFTFNIEAAYDGEPEVNFVDLNNDGYEDVILKMYQDECYYPLILFNNSNKSFNVAFKYECCLCVDSNFQNANLKKAEKHEEYYLKAADGNNNEKELIFLNLDIKEVQYINVIFHLTKDNKHYYILRKTLVNNK